LTVKIFYLAAEHMFAVKARGGKNAALRYAKKPSKCFASGFVKITVSPRSLFFPMREAIG
jgi:hypothetical protein